MASILAQAKTAPLISNLVAQGDTAGTGILLHWTNPVDLELASIEIWVATTNDRASASLVRTVVGNSYFYIGTAGTTYYFWVRSVNTFGSSTGAWVPSGATSGVSATVGLIVTSQITPNAVTIAVFGTTNTAIVGNGAYQAAVVFNATNTANAAMPFFCNFTGKQTYSSGARDTKWLFYDNTLAVTVFDWGTSTNIDELPAVSIGYSVAANTTKQLILFWWGADSTVTLASRSFHATGYLR